MKKGIYKVLLVSLITTFIISCKENKEKNLQNEIEEKIKTGLNDPSSYEFNHFYIDSLGYTSKKELIVENLEEINKLQKQTEDKKAEDKIIDLEVENQRFEMLNKYKFTGTFSFRGNNKFGAKILAEYRFEADSTYTLMYLIDNTGDTIYKDIEIEMKETDELIKGTDKLLNDN